MGMIPHLRSLLAAATPGEWFLAGWDVDAPGHVNVARCGPEDHDGVTDEQAEANASLIAAAVSALPALIEVAEAAGKFEVEATAMRRLLESGGYSGADFDAVAERQHDRLQDLRAALAKLEGK